MSFGPVTKYVCLTAWVIHLLGTTNVYCDFRVWIFDRSHTEQRCCQFPKWRRRAILWWMTLKRGPLTAMWGTGDRGRTDGLPAVSAQPKPVQHWNTSASLTELFTRGMHINVSNHVHCNFIESDHPWESFDGFVFCFIHQYIDAYWGEQVFYTPGKTILSRPYLPSEQRAPGTRA